MGGENMKKRKEPVIVTDPFGSYTGLGKEPPVQDADDL